MVITGFSYYDLPYCNMMHAIRRECNLTFKFCQIAFGDPKNIFRLLINLVSFGSIYFKHILETSSFMKKPSFATD